MRVGNGLRCLRRVATYDHAMLVPVGRLNCCELRRRHPTSTRSIQKTNPRVTVIFGLWGIETQRYRFRGVCACVGDFQFSKILLLFFASATF